jgi:LysM repeat protein
MAIYPGGYNDVRAARLRIVLYSVAAAIVVGVLVVVGYVLIRHRRAKTAQNVPPETVVGAEPARPSATAEPNVVSRGVSTAVVTEPNREVAGLIAQAMSLLNQQPPKIIGARERLNEILPMAEGQERAFIKEQLTALADKWLFSKLVYPEDKLCTGYKVNPGDVLENIGKKYNVPYEILMQMNNIAKPELLQAGVAIKVINGPFHARVWRSTFTMDLYLQNTYVRSFPVGLGKPGMETPTGRWRAKEGGKLIQPIWTDPVSGKTYHPEDADYPLGSRWVGLEGLEGAAVGKTGFAIHGTKSPEQIGTPGSQGCIRLHNGDAILVYNLMMPGVSLVDVVD